MNNDKLLRAEVRRGAYFDSITLMRLQAALASQPGIADAAVMMGTPANRELLEASGLLPDASNAQAGGPAVAAAKGDDLMIVVQAGGSKVAHEALDQVDELLAAGRGGGRSRYRPRSLDAARRQLPQAQWLLISAPGRYAGGLAHQGLDLGLNVFLYSDNVSLQDEVALKTKAVEKGLLVMGPDCGTAAVAGHGLGFANAVRTGPVGLVAASGTGLQAVASRIHGLGSGVSHALGTGGRDLSQEVAGRTALQALDLLRRDEATEVIVLISKPPAAPVARDLLRVALHCGKPVVVCFLGAPSSSRRVGEVYFAGTLLEAAELAVTACKAQPGLERAVLESPAAQGAGGGKFLGLFSGGTLAQEALVGLRRFLGSVTSNLDGSAATLGADLTEHRLLDLGSDELTVGRLHPMMDATLRLQTMASVAQDPGLGVLALDVVLGFGSDPDPARELAPAIKTIIQEASAAGRTVQVLVLLIGTDEDPQDFSAQKAAFESVGAQVVESVEVFVEKTVLSLMAAPDLLPKPVALEVLSAPVAALNLGLESFAESLLEQGAEVLALDWRPPAGGNEKLAAILEKMKG